MKLNAATRLLAYEIKPKIDPSDRKHIIEWSISAFRRAKKITTISLGEGELQIIQKKKSYCLRGKANGEDIVYMVLSKSKLGKNTYSPHTIVMEGFQNQGLMTNIYKWLLDAGIVFITDGGQSEGAHRLWNKLQTMGYKSYLIKIGFYDDKLYEIEPFTKPNKDTTYERVLCKNYTLEDIQKGFRK